MLLEHEAKKVNWKKLFLELESEVKLTRKRHNGGSLDTFFLCVKVHSCSLCFTPLYWIIGTARLYLNLQPNCPSYI
jgi:hypothetical protein